MDLTLGEYLLLARILVLSVIPFFYGFGELHSEVPKREGKSAFF